jgi:endo-1,4-beta-mannosidase
VASTDKPLILGEFGALGEPAASYDSWLTTILLEGGGGAMVWQLLGGARSINDGYGFRCPDAGSLCALLQESADRMSAKAAGEFRAPASFSLHQNYPNPFNGQTTISYNLPVDSHVSVSLFTVLGEKVVSLVEEYQRAGTRKELFDAGSLATGAYYYEVRMKGNAGQDQSATGKLLIVK